MQNTAYAYQGGSAQRGVLFEQRDMKRKPQTASRPNR